MSAKKASIGLIAREAGCSPSTVSRVLGGYTKGFSVRPELEAKILELSREFDYKPNPYLRSMRTNKTRIIAVFDPLAGDGGVVQSAKQEFIAKIREADYIDAGKYVDLEQPGSYTLSFPVDGALLFDIVDGVCLNFVEENRIPYVTVNGYCRGHGTSVMPDEAANMRKLTDYLYSLGHRRIAYYAGHKRVYGPALHYSVAAREAHYQENVERLGLIHASAHWNRQISPEEFLQQAFHREKMTAVICYDHAKALKLIHAAWKLGIRIPEELSVCSFNDAYPLDLLTPPVTCIATPGREMGALAARLLLETLDGKRQDSGEIIPVQGELIVRESVRAL
ncbi:LacI family DNA-binding transcriptional regulator [Victivallis vadensis]|jgi:transcriptional regulator, lacI family|uniref:LacI family DNA-binding transcriptional regulator n=1 Tax=Victivallis vadensis TaxID=172901 RepID=UPI003AF63C2B